MNKAIVIFSGGQDSTTCLAIAKRENDFVYALTFDYGQNHSHEIEASSRIANRLNVDHEILKLPDNILVGDSPLTNKSYPVSQYQSVDDFPDGVEPTFVHGRNILFLAIAANRAAVIGANRIYIGVCEADHNGYWDCRHAFIDSMEFSLNQGINGNRGDKISIKTPLMYKSKKDGILLAITALGPDFNNVFSMTHTCYDNVVGGCGKCHSCLVRQAGFDELGMVDPIKKS